MLRIPSRLCLLLLFALPLGCISAKTLEQEVIEQASASIAQYDSGAYRAFHGHVASPRRLVMPNPGLAIRTYQAISEPLDHFLYFEFMVPDAGDKAPVVVILDKKSAVEIEARDRHRIVVHDKRANRADVVRLGTKTQGIVSASFERTSNGVRFCVYTTCRILGDARNVEVRVVRGVSYLTNPQAIGRNNRVRQIAGSQAGIRRFPAPRGVLAWEKMSLYLHHTTLNLSAGYQLCKQKPYAHRTECKAISKRVPEIAKSIVLQVAQWPNWRAFDETRGDRNQSASSDADFKTWDRGNWSNGYLAYATAGLAYLADNGTWGATLDSIAPAFRTKLVNYLKNDIYHSNAGHWITRSNNHGAIILGNAYAAALLMNKCKEDDLARSLRNSFRKVAEGSFEDGIYVESFVYLQVFVFESLAASITRQQCFNESFHTAFSRMYGAVKLEEIASASARLTTPSGRFLVPFGDCCGKSGWRRDALEILAQVNEPMRELLKRRAYTMEGSPALRWLTRRQTTRPSSPIADRSRSAPLQCFKTNVGIVSADFVKNGRRMQAAVSSTRFHYTHTRIGTWERYTLPSMASSWSAREWTETPQRSGTRIVTAQPGRRTLSQVGKDVTPVALLVQAATSTAVSSGSMNAQVPAKPMSDSTQAKAVSVVGAPSRYRGKTGSRSRFRTS